MKGNGKKREWVKTAAIVFLSVMLVLTFFSNTIMNYSLPEVATQYVQPGSITAKIRGAGVVESGDPYNVLVNETRKVAGVAVRVGDVVAKGDVLLYLEEQESEELQVALDMLEAAQEAYDERLLSASITSAEIVAAQNGVSASDYRWRITKAQNEIQAEQDKLIPLKQKKAELEKRSNDINEQLKLEANTNSSIKERLATAEIARDIAADNKDAKATILQSAQTNRQNLEIMLAEAKAYLESVSGNDVVSAEAAVMNLEAKVTAAKSAEKTAQDNYNAAAVEYNTALSNYNTAKSNSDNRDASNVVTNLNDQLAAIRIEMYHLDNEWNKGQEAVTQKEEDLNELVGTMSDVLELDKYLKAIYEAKEAVDKLKMKEVATTITAPISGTISTINVIAGQSTISGEAVVVMQPEGQGYTLSFSVTNEQARRLNVGDRADLINAWRYDDVEVVLANIKPDKSNPGQQKMLTFHVNGAVMAGQTLNLSVGQKSASYDYIVPNSAIREDNNGQFILIVESKQSPLGTRYTASRVDVQVIAKDDTQSAITGAINGYEFVITTSTAPVQAGELVRLAE